MKATLVPFLAPMGFLSGPLLVDVGLPRGLGLVGSLTLGPVLPWLVLRALNRSLRSWFAVGHDGLETGLGRFRRRAAFDGVALIRESYAGEASGPYVFGGPADGARR